MARRMQTGDVMSDATRDVRMPGASATPARSSSGRWGTRRLVRGFTLIELLIVVAMIGVLAALALAGYRKYLSSAGSSEAVAVLSNIRSAQEQYKSETLSYLAVTGTDGGGLDDLYPRAQSALNDAKVGWGGAGNGEDNWKILNVRPDGPVRFGYACVANIPGTNPPTGELAGAPDPGWENAYGGGAAPEPWFVASAIGDRDDDDVYAVLQTSSLSSEVFVHDDTE